MSHNHVDLTYDNTGMWECQKCGDRKGPFEIADIRNRVMFVCEKCARKARKEKKENETAGIFNKRHGNRVSCTNCRCK